LLLFLGVCLFTVGSSYIAGMPETSVSANTTAAQDKKTLEAEQAKLGGIKDRKKDLENKIANGKFEAQTLLKQKELLEEEYTLLVQEEEAISAIITEYGNVIEGKIAEGENKERELEEQLDDFGSILVDLYRYGDDTALEVFLRSETYAAYVSYQEGMTQLLKSSDAMVDAINDTIENIEKTKLEYEEAKDKLEDYKADLDVAIQQKLEKQAEVEEKQRQVNEQIKNNQATYDSMKKDEEEMAAKIKDLQKQIQKKLEEEFKQNAKNYTGTFSWLFAPGTYAPVTSGYGNRPDPFTGQTEFHNGIDLQAAKGTPIRAADAGIVSIAGWYGGFGNAVVIEHGGGISTLYAHCDSLLVSPNMKVAKDQVIARVGSTGRSTGNHLHFSVLKNGNYINPSSYLTLR